MSEQMNKFAITAVGPFPDFDTMYVVDKQKGHVYFTYEPSKATTYDTQKAAGDAAQSIAASTKTELSVEQIWVIGEVKDTMESVHEEYTHEYAEALATAASDIWMSMQAMNGDPTIDCLE